MKILRLLALLLIIPFSLIFSSERSSQLYARILNLETPSRTVVINDERAQDPVQYFSKSKEFTFYIYKIGTGLDAERLTELLRFDGSVHSCRTGALNGDLQEIHLTLKELRNLSWFRHIFRNAGLNTIKINDRPVVDVLEL